MANVFEAAPDGRQSDERISVSRFRPLYRALSEEEKRLHDEIKAKAVELEALFERAYALACPHPVLEPLPAIADGEVHEVLIGASIPWGPFETPPKKGYFADAVKSLELAVMWVIKGLTS